MKRINEDIKNGEFQRLYLLYGEEAYLRLQYRQKLVKALVPEEDTMNTAFFEGKNINPREIIDLAETMPFFAERRVIVLQDTGIFKNKCDELADYLSGELPDYLCMIFVEEEADKRGRMYKAVKKAGYAAEFSSQSTEVLTKWVLQKIAKEGKKITKREMDLFLTMTGNDMGNISNELEKLLSYGKDKAVITREDILEICTPQIQNKIFDMVRAVADHRQETALQLYYDLLALKEPPMRILFLIARQFNQLLQVKELQSDGKSQRDMASILGMHPFAVKKNLECARQYTFEELKYIIEDCMESEEAVKTGRLGDVISVELLIIRHSKKQPR